VSDDGGTGGAPAPAPAASSGFVGEPDGLERLWTPHRMAYIDGHERPSDGSVEECPFCAAPRYDDTERLVVVRGEHAYVILNLFPYNSGHVLVCPYRHVSDYTELTDAERDEVAVLTQEAMTVIRTASSPAGFNIGMNQGAAAGAGIAAHLHQHVVPRWQGDANFFPIVARTKAMPQLLGDTRELLARTWHDVTGRATTVTGRQTTDRQDADRQDTDRQADDRRNEGPDR